MTETVAVLFGGRSAEHGVSCVTAGSVMAAIDREQYQVLAVGIDSAGTWTVQSDHSVDWQMSDGILPQVHASEVEVLLPRAVGQPWRLLQAGSTTEIDVSVVFPVLHGPWGEDGTIQGALELLGIPFVGSGVLASALGMDKVFMKQAFRAAGLPVAPEVVLAADAEVATVTAAVAELGLPVFVKPARGGSSFGISRIDDLAELPSAVALARQYDRKVLIEAAIPGREIETAVLQTNAGLQVSLPGEIVTSSAYEFYDVQAKYFDSSGAELICPATLPSSVQSRVQDFARRAFSAISAAGLARVDVFVDGEEVVVNEINTMPGFTPISMYPRMWQQSGKAYPELIADLLLWARTAPRELPQG